MKRLVLTIIFVFQGGVSLFAQDVFFRNRDNVRNNPIQIFEDDPYRVRHVSDYLNRLPASLEALKTFHERRRQGLLPVRKLGRTNSINDTETFKVINFETETLEEIEFTLKVQEDRFWIWVETAELTNGHVRDEDVESFRKALKEQTPAGSINPNAGIIVNDEEVFGDPPDVDGDGITDVLLVDIRDGWAPGDAYVAGFVSPQDMTEAGNYRDVIYADTRPGLYRNGTHIQPIAVEATIAHEYQHLIRYNYDSNELTFIDEGMSEWAELINGYPSRVMTFLSETGEHNTKLFDWRDGDAVLKDYQRAGLFTAYLAQRIGVEATGRIVQLQKENFGRLVPITGVEGYKLALNEYGLTVADLVADFYTTNYFNDRSIDENLGYEHPDFRYLSTPASYTIDGQSRQTFNITDFTLNGGSVQYYTFTDVKDFVVNADIHEAIAPALIPGMRTRVRVRVFQQFQDGRRERVDFGLGAEGRTIPGDFERLTMMVTHIAPQKNGIRLDISTSWDEAGDPGFALTPRVYDDGVAVFYPLAPGDLAGFATKFVVPEHGKLHEISLPIYYGNQFDGGQPDTSPRDFNLTVWAVNADGAPGDVLYTEYVEDPRQSEDVFMSETENRYLEIDVSVNMEEISLPELVFVGATNAGTDENYIVFSASQYADEDLSYYRNEEGIWMPSWERIFSTGETLLQNHIIPIRATFSVSAPVAVDDPHENPTRFLLEQNYPNPFNPTTTIRYQLDLAARVRLAVYDVLGRTVTVLVDAFQQTGTYDVHFDASSLAGGLYVYSLESDARRFSKTMMLIK